MHAATRQISIVTEVGVKESIPAVCTCLHDDAGSQYSLSAAAGQVDCRCAEHEQQQTMMADARAALPPASFFISARTDAQFPQQLKSGHEQLEGVAFVRYFRSEMCKCCMQPILFPSSRIFSTNTPLPPRAYMIHRGPSGLGMAGRIQNAAIGFSLMT